MKKMPVFNVFASDMNGRKIEVVNIFEYGQMNRIVEELKKVKKAVNKAQKSYEAGVITLNELFVAFDGVSKKFFYKHDEEEISDVKKEFKKDSGAYIKYALDKKLNGEMLYYFWSKVEHEVIIKDMFGEDEMKVDIFKQVHMNWDYFKSLVFDMIGVK